jgi:hypothetical protein
MGTQILIVLEIIIIFQMGVFKKTTRIPASRLLNL